MNKKGDYAVLKVSCDGSVDVLPLSERQLQLPFLKKQVNGYIEVVRCNLLVALDPFLSMVVDEEGFLKDDPVINVLASALYDGGNPIAGDVVIVTTERSAEEEPDIYALSGLQASYLKSLFDRYFEVLKEVGATASVADLNGEE